MNGTETDCSAAQRNELDKEISASPPVLGASPAAARRSRAEPLLKVLAALVFAIVVLAVIFYSNTRDSDGARPTSEMAGQYAFMVGDPGPGQPAPPIRLRSTEGIVDLSSWQGKRVLLYFQEGLMCQPCWDQLKEIEKEWGRFEAIGIDGIASITTDPLDALEQKVADEELTTPVLSDPDPMFHPESSVQEAYRTNRYGMMGKMHSGHTFIVVGPDGRILWRADYGGAPDYTMYLPVKNLLADVRRGLGLD